MLGRYFTVDLVFEVAATSREVGLSKVFAVLMKAFGSLNDESEARLARYYDLVPPHSKHLSLLEGLVVFPPPEETGEKSVFQVREDIKYTKRHCPPDWPDWEASTRWIYALFETFGTDDVRLVLVDKTSLFHFD